jgi:hypothetical protein
MERARGDHESVSIMSTDALEVGATMVTWKGDRASIAIKREVKTRLRRFAAGFGKAPRL